MPNELTLILTIKQMSSKTVVILALLSRCSSMPLLHGIIHCDSLMYERDPLKNKRQ